MLSLPCAWVQFPVGELRFHKLHEPRPTKPNSCRFAPAVQSYTSVGRLGLVSSREDSWTNAFRTNNHPEPHGLQGDVKQSPFFHLILAREVAAADPAVRPGQGLLQGSPRPLACHLQGVL